MKKIYNLKTLIMVFSLAFFTLGKTYAQKEKKAREILDKTSVVVAAPNGVHANFKVSSTAGISISGNISRKISSVLPLHKQPFGMTEQLNGLI